MFPVMFPGDEFEINTDESISIATIGLNSGIFFRLISHTLPPDTREGYMFGNLRNS